ncbi:GNAT family N-acetyltransferase [Gorillibacterium sp. CAU 1737]|uniref:GNAT family N-acetyltransferase n=1 Tax=Gorillibacterium sp. CAU 1737 TaxID=3140362 RepID=UPI0032615AA2
MIHLKRARPEEASVLTAIQKESFDRECTRYGQEEQGGPPGYAEEAWQLAMMQDMHYFAILEGEEETAEGDRLDRLIGGAIVSENAAAGICHLGRIFLHPDKQGSGMGKVAMLALEQQYPDAIRWELDTPDWALRNHRFYPSCGYRKVNEANGFYYYAKDKSPSPPDRG